ncbi:hypothetical protein [Sphingosinicella sp. CPCC 101087]|uniref:hypothetical protein n=1 Tax=Sphingosinicella sp. CPCC 101087 TaxID=2497754 RepID=UPI00101CBE14|nr:hypothetical protein [Sphingosinicella sp. CPCC 101087]
MAEVLAIAGWIAAAALAEARRRALDRLAVARARIDVLEHLVEGSRWECRPSRWPEVADG